MDEEYIGVEFITWIEEKGKELEELKGGYQHPVLTFDSQRLLVTDLGDEFRWLVEVPPGYPKLSDAYGCREPLFKVKVGRKGVPFFPPPENNNPGTYIEEILPGLLLYQLTDPDEENNVLEFLCQSSGKSKLELMEEFSRHGWICLKSLQCATRFTDVLHAIFQFSVAWSSYRQLLSSHVSAKKSKLFTEEQKKVSTFSSTKGREKTTTSPATSSVTGILSSSFDNSDSYMRTYYYSWDIIQAEVKEAADACESASQAVMEAASVGGVLLSGIFHDHHSRSKLVQSTTELQTRGKFSESQILSGYFPRSMDGEENWYTGTISRTKKLWSDDDADKKMETDKAITDYFTQFSEHKYPVTITAKGEGTTVENKSSKQEEECPLLNNLDVLEATKSSHGARCWPRASNENLLFWRNSDGTRQRAGVSAKFGEKCRKLLSFRSRDRSPPVDSGTQTRLTSKNWTTGNHGRTRKMKMGTLQPPESPSRTIVSKVAIEEGNTLHWCLIDVESKSSPFPPPFSCTICLHEFVHEVAARVMGIDTYKPLHLDVVLGDDLVGHTVGQYFSGTVRVIADQPGEVSPPSVSASSNHPQSCSKSLGLSFLVPHIVAEYFQKHSMRVCHRQDFEIGSNLFIGLLQTVVKRLSNLATNCPVCGDPLRATTVVHVKTIFAPRSCEKNLCISLFTLWSQLAPFNALSDYTPISFLQPGGVLDPSQEEELRQVEEVRQEVLARNCFPYDSSSMANLDSVLKSKRSNLPQLQGSFYEVQELDQSPDELDNFSYYDKIKDLAQILCWEKETNQNLTTG